MTGSEMVRAALMSAGLTQVELAAHMGWSKQNLNSRLKNDSLSVEEVEKALALAGFKLKVVADDGSEPPKLNNSDSPKLTQMVDGVLFDTTKAESICTTRLEHSEDFYMELFRDVDGRFFIAYYQTWDGGRSTISPVTKKVAESFCQKYGPIGSYFVL